MNLFSFLKGRKKTYSGTVRRTAAVMTAASNGTAFFGVLFHGEPEWLRVYTSDLGLASAVAFLLPDEEVSLEVQGRFRQGRHTWYRLVRVTGEPVSAVDARQNGPG